MLHKTNKIVSALLSAIAINILIFPSVLISACGYSDSPNETKPTNGEHTHNFIEYDFDCYGHSLYCSVCGKKKDKSTHTGTDKCTLCDCPLTDTAGLEYKLNGENNGYTVVGMGSANENVIRIPAAYNGLPVTEIADNAFFGNKTITRCLIPNGVAVIGEYSFAGCASLKSISIPESVTSIGDIAFVGCSSLIGITVSPDNAKYKSVDNCLLTKDGQSLIIGCKNSVIPDGVTAINVGAFYNCTSLTSITIPNGVNKIASSAFEGCCSLESIFIPNSVTSIEGYALCGYSPLTIYCEAKEQPNGWDSKWNAYNHHVVWGYKPNN